MTKINRRTHKKETINNLFPFNKMWHICRLFIVASVSMFTLGVTGFYGMQLAQDFLNRPIANITVKGEFNHVSKELLTHTVRTMMGGSFIGENISRIKVSLESIPWIDGVDLSRRWPDQLEIIVREQIPIARWGNSGFVNVRGEIIFVENDNGLLNLSTLMGEKQDSDVIMQQYSVLANTLQPYNLFISRLEKNKRGVWKLALSNHWEIVIGRVDMHKKIQRFTSLLQSKTLDAGMPIVSIDLRYTNGVAVNWIGDAMKIQDLVLDRSSLNDVEEVVKNSSVIHLKVRQRLVGEKQYARG